MKKLLLLATLCIAVITHAQQMTLDSLLNELSKHPKEDTTRLNLLNDAAREYHAVNPSKGLETADAAIVLAQKLNADKSLVLAYKNKALNYNSKGDRTSALQWYNKAFDLCKRSGLHELEARIYHDIGIVYFDMSDYAKAIQMQEESLKLSQQKNDSAGMARAYVSIGTVHQFLSSYANALQYQQMALNIFTRLHDAQGMTDAYNNLGLVYLHKEDFPKALSYYQQALELDQRSGDRQSTANVLGNIATVYDNMEDSLNAIQSYQKALAISEEIGYAYGIASNTANIGIFYYYQSEYSLALPYLEKALASYEKLNDKNNQSLLLNILGNLYAEAPGKLLIASGINPVNRDAVAIEYYERSLGIARKIKALKRQAYALESLSTIYEKQNNYKKAYEFYKQLTAINDTIAGNSTTGQITRLEMQNEFKRAQDSVKAVNDKERALADAEIKKQRIVKNSMMAGAGFLILTGIGAFVFYKRNQDTKNKKNEAELTAKVTDIEMKALRAQMNPHFIFNSLNSIADYIDKNQTKIAADFTTKFARLMRMVLENSEHKQIPLADDLKALELYMQLESFRLQNKFSYTINVDDNVDKDNTLVPPLILQPFVENSIWHGIAKKEGAGSIKIFIKQEGQNINCIVEDDGVGMQDEIAGKEKTSLGMRITKARIDIINKLKNTNASMRIANKEKGVRAEVELPLVLSF
ncbi:MAG TPA: tetratricopeptide repeat protein [Parafilimonas sp.]|nr:tetratricopeptide repeat protein [Parafilimonas sp.]